MRRVRLDLLAQAAHVHHQRVFIAQVLAPPGGHAQRVHGHDAAPVFVERRKQRVFLGREGALRAVAADHAGFHVHRHRPQADHAALPRRAVGAAQHRAQPQRQLPWQKGLGDIVVRAKAQPAQARLVLVARRKEQNRRLRKGPQFLQERKAVPVGQHHVQNHGVGPELPRLRKRLRRRGRLVNVGVTVAAQYGQKHPPKLRFVVHHQQPRLMHIAHAHPLLPVIIPHRPLQNRGQRKS